MRYISLALITLFSLTAYIEDMEPAQKNTCIGFDLAQITKAKPSEIEVFDYRNVTVLDGDYSRKITEPEEMHAIIQAFKATDMDGANLQAWSRPVFGKRPTGLVVLFRSDEVAGTRKLEIGDRHFLAGVFCNQPMELNIDSDDHATILQALGLSAVEA